VAEKQHAEEITEMQRANAVGGSPLYTHGLGYAYAAAGNKTSARAVIDVLNYMPRISSRLGRSLVSCPHPPNHRS
jgi:hypothetical protein